MNSLNLIDNKYGIMYGINNNNNNNNNNNKNNDNNNMITIAFFNSGHPIAWFAIFIGEKR